MRELHAQGAKNVQAASVTVSELRSENQQLRSENARLVEQAKAPKTHLEKLVAGFKVPEGEEAYLHVAETQVGGEELTKPRIRPYDPQQYDTMISKQAGYKATVLHDPRKKA